MNVTYEASMECSTKTLRSTNWQAFDGCSRVIIEGSLGAMTDGAGGLPIFSDC